MEIVVVEDEDEGEDPAAEFASAPLFGRADDGKFPVSFDETSRIQSWTIDPVSSEWLEKLSEGFSYSEMSWLKLYYAAGPVTRHDRLFRAYLFEPITRHPIDPTSYYALWAGGASIWMTEENLEVRLSRALRVEVSSYQG